MANVLKMALIEAIVSLHRRGWSRRRIARELGVDRATVSRHLRTALEGSNAANAPLGSASLETESNAANAPIGSEAIGEQSNAAIAPLGSEGPAAGELNPVLGTADNHSCLSVDSSSGSARHGPGRPSVCALWRETILGKLEQGLSAQRIYQDLVTEHGFAGSYYSVRRYVGRLGERGALPFRRMECAAGEEAQGDFGTGAPTLFRNRRGPARPVVP